MSLTPRKKRFFAALTSLFCLLAALLSLGAAPRAEALQTLSFSVLPEKESVAAPPPATSAGSMVLLDAGSGNILAEKDADTRRPMASTTKIMTALVVLETMSPDTIIRVPAAAVGVEGSSVYLFAGEEITIRTLLYALLLSSANDAAEALALTVAGSIEAFADQMNRKAAALGLADTHFVNPHGLHDEAHYTTARDLARLTAAALANPAFAEIVASARYSVPQNGTDATRLFLNHNRLLRSYEGTIGVKTGYTKAAGRCLVSAARRDGLTLIAVTLNDPNDWRDHTALHDWGFSQYVALAPMLPTLSLPVVGGEQSAVALTHGSTPALTLPAAHGEITCKIEAPRFLYAGFAAGTPVGRAIYTMDGEVLAEVELVTARAAEKESQRRGLWQKIKDFFGDFI